MFALLLLARRSVSSFPSFRVFITVVDYCRSHTTPAPCSTRRSASKSMPASLLRAPGCVQLITTRRICIRRCPFVCVSVCLAYTQPSLTAPCTQQLHARNEWPGHHQRHHQPHWHAERQPAYGGDSDGFWRPHRQDAPRDHPLFSRRPPGAPPRNFSFRCDGDSASIVLTN